MVPSEQPSGVAARGRVGWGWLVGLGCEGGRGRRVSRLQRMYVCIVVNIYVLFGKKYFWGGSKSVIGDNDIFKLLGALTFSKSNNIASQNLLVSSLRVCFVGCCCLLSKAHEV